MTTQQQTETVLVIGNTYPAKDLLKEFGGIWQPATKGWVLTKSKWDELQTTNTPSWGMRRVKTLAGLRLAGESVAPSMPGVVRALCRRCGTHCYGDCSANG